MQMEEIRLFIVENFCELLRGQRIARAVKLAPSPKAVLVA
jgi:hypothetical protein